MKNKSTITLILLTINLTIPQMAQADEAGCKAGVRRNLLPTPLPLLKKSYSSGPAISPGPEDSSSQPSSIEVRKPVDQNLLAAHPEINAVGSALLDSAGRALTSAKVSQCVVMINLHIFDHSDELKSASGKPLVDDLLKMTEKQLIDSPETRFTLGFLPNGKKGFKAGHDILVSGKVMQTGRRILNKGEQLEQTVNRFNDYLLLKVENPSREFLKLPTFQLASPEEINEAVVKKAKGEIFGQPSMLVQNGQRIYYQKGVELKFSKGNLLRHNGVVTPGGSGSIIGISVGPIYKMVGIVNDTREYTDDPSVEGVHVAAFRDAVTQAQSIKCD